MEQWLPFLPPCVPCVGVCRHSSYPVPCPVSDDNCIIKRHSNCICPEAEGIGARSKLHHTLHVLPERQSSSSSFRDKATDADTERQRDREIKQLMQVQRCNTINRLRRGPTSFLLIFLFLQAFLMRKLKLNGSMGMAMKLTPVLVSHSFCPHLDRLSEGRTKADCRPMCRASAPISLLRSATLTWRACFYKLCYMFCHAQTSHVWKSGTAWSCWQ
jgi:hypothetical protein